MDEAKNQVERLQELPVHPYVLGKLLSVLAEPAPSVHALVQLAFSDPGLTACLLRASSDALFMVPTAIPAPRHIVDRLGVAGIRSTILRMALASVFDQPPGLYPRLAAFWRASLMRAVCSRLIADRQRNVSPHEAYLSGLLLHIGDLAIEQVALNTHAALEDPDTSGLTSDKTPHTIPAQDHAAAGKWLAERWRFPERLTEVIWLHHHPPTRLEGTHYPLALLHTVALADAITEQSQNAIMHVPEGLLIRMGLTGSDIDLLRAEAQEAVRARIASFALDQGSPEELRNALRRATLETLEAHARADAETAAARRQAHRFLSLHNMNQQLRPGCSLDETLTIIVRSIREGLAIAPGICCAVDPDANTLHLRTWRSESASPQAFTVDLKHASLVGTNADEAPVFRALSALGLDVRQLENGWTSTDFRAVNQWEGLVAAPMLVGDRCYGQILFDAAASNFELSEDEFAEFLAFAGACGLAVARCHAERRLIHHKEDLAAALERTADDEDLEIRLRQSEQMAWIGEFAESAALSMNAPLNLASAQMKWFAGKIPDPKQREALETIMRHTRNARQTVKDLLLLTRPVAPKLEPFLINYVLRQILAGLSEEFHDRDIRLTEKFGEGLPRLMADRRLIEHALRNLVVHALDAMNDRSGALTIHTSATSDRQAVCIAFTDTGPGFVSSQAAELFEPFSTLRKPQGASGLGLAVCREIIQAHGGRIDVISAPDQGATLTVRLPAASAIPRAEEPPAAEGSKLSRDILDKEELIVLIADDAPNVREALRKALAERGWGTLTAEDGAQAIEAIQSNRLDLIILDMKMPFTDGYAVLDDLRERNIPTPVIAMTGSTNPDDADDAVRRGARSCLRKPFELQHLLDEVDDIVRALQTNW